MQHEPTTKVAQSTSHNRVVSGQMQVQQYTGPLPPPAVLQGYKEVDPTLPDRIVSEFEKNSEHIRYQEKEALQAQIRDTKRAQYMAFFISITLLGVVSVSIASGNLAFAGVSGLAFIAMLASNFLLHLPNRN